VVKKDNLSQTSTNFNLNSVQNKNTLSIKVEDSSISTDYITDSLNKTISQKNSTTTELKKISNSNCINSAKSISNSSNKCEIEEEKTTPIKMQLLDKCISFVNCNLVQKQSNGSNIISGLKSICNDSESLDSDISIQSKKIGLSSFVCLGILGRGSFGVVYLVKHKKTKTLYAMKILSKNKIMGIKYILKVRRSELSQICYDREECSFNYKSSVHC